MPDLTQDQVLAQLQTRGFEEGFVATPLRDFWATLTAINGTMREGDRGSYLVVLYDFQGNDLEVIETNEPYTSPIAQLEVPHSNRAKSKMGYLGASIDNIINAGLPADAPIEQAKKQEYLIGKKLHMKFTPGHGIPKKVDNEWTDAPTSCWELIEIAGEGPAPVAAPAVTTAAPAPAVPVPAPAAPVAPTLSASQQALALLDGKTEQQWHQVVLTDPTVKADTAFMQTIINREFIKAQELAKIITKDADGTYHIARQ